MEGVVAIGSGVMFVVIAVAAYFFWWRRGDQAGGLEIVTIGLTLDTPVFAGSLYALHLFSIAAQVVILALLGAGLVASLVAARLRWRTEVTPRGRVRAILFVIIFGAFILITMVSVVAPGPLGGPM